MNRFRLLSALFLGGAILAAPAAASHYARALDQALFRAGPEANVKKAKAIVEKYRARHGTTLSTDYLDTVDACYAAGPAKISAKKRRSILAHDNIREFYAPNINMKIAEGFANGWGVKADLKRATAFACRANTVPNELINQVRKLTRGDFTARAPFLYCYNVTSSDAIGECAAYTENQVEKRREAEFMQLTWNYDAAEKHAFKKLRAAAESYFDASAKYEIGDDLGRPRRLAYIQLMDASRDHFITLLKSVEHKHFPPEKTEGYHPDYADHELNALYRDILRNTEWKDPLDHPGAQTKEGLKRTERAWIRYKEAWLGFLHLRQPAAPHIREMTAYLTGERIVVLRKMYNEP